MYRCAKIRILPIPGVVFTAMLRGFYYLRVLNLLCFCFPVYICIEPPELTQQTVEMDCNTPLNDSRPAKIAWMVI